MSSTRHFTFWLNLVTALGVAAVVLVPTLTAERPAAEGGWVAHNTLETTQAHAGKAENVPSWGNTDAASQAGCVSLLAFGPTEIPAALLVSDREGVTHRLAYTEANVEAIKRSGRPADNPDALYVVGACQ